MKTKLKLVYSKHGPAISDFEVANFKKSLLEAYSKLDNESITIMTSSQLGVLQLQVLIKKGVLDKSKVELLFYRDLVMTTIKIDKFGELDQYPDGFCEAYSNLLMRLI